LFAPGVGEHGRFLRVELKWDDGRPAAVVAAELEPADMARYFRWGHSRLRKYEAFLGATLTIRDGEPMDEARARWQPYIRSKVRQQSDVLPGYMLWRWRVYQQEHPGCPPPAEMVMHIVCWRIPPPASEPWTWQGPVNVPFARVRVDSADGLRCGPVQAYNPLSGQFTD
jgi:hypothetical protein